MPQNSNIRTLETLIYVERWPSFYADTVVVVDYQKIGVPVLTATNIKFHLNMEYTIFFFKIPGVFIRFFCHRKGNKKQKIYLSLMSFY